MERLEIPENLKGNNIPRPHKSRTRDKAEFLAEWEGQPYKPLFGCPICGGKGFVHPPGLNGKPDYSKVVRCKQPKCYNDSFMAWRQGIILENSGILDPNQTFETFDQAISGAKKAYVAAKAIAEGDSSFIWLLIYGGVGNGKTHLLNAIADVAAKRGQAVKLVMMAELLSELRIAMDAHQTDNMMKELKEVEYLLVDELGLEYGAAWEQAKTDELLTARFAHGRFTVCATNLDIEELPERIKSRFMDGHLSRRVLNTAGDYRLKKG